MSHFRCWRPEIGIELDDAFTLKIPWANHDDAAEKYVERKFADWEYPREVTVVVQEIGDGEDPVGAPRTFVVTVEAAPVFSAREVPK